MYAGRLCGLLGPSVLRSYVVHLYSLRRKHPNNSTRSAALLHQLPLFSILFHSRTCVEPVRPGRIITWGLNVAPYRVIAVGCTLTPGRGKVNEEHALEFAPLCPPPPPMLDVALRVWQLYQYLAQGAPRARLDVSTQRANSSCSPRWLPCASDKSADPPAKFRHFAETQRASSSDCKEKKLAAVQRRSQPPLSSSARPCSHRSLCQRDAALLSSSRL